MEDIDEDVRHLLVANDVDAAVACAVVVVVVAVDDVNYLLTVVDFVLLAPLLLTMEV